MTEFDRSSNVKEERATRALVSLVPGVILVLVGAWMYAFPEPAMAGLRLVLVIAGAAAIGYGVWQLSLMRKITTYNVTCPFCQAKNTFTEQPMEDVRCNSCNREVPILNGQILKVFQVRCGYCNTLNWYSEKSTGLICEECDREIPISTDDEHAPSKAFHAFTRHDDDAPYNLVLIDPGPKHEEIIPVLQKMLALNRNQVKDIMDEVPVVLLQGVPKKKAELMAAQIQAHGGRANSTPTP